MHRPFLICLILPLLVLACNQGSNPAASSLAIPVEFAPSQPPDTIPPPCDGFDYPVGPPDGKGYYNAQVFGKNKHLGDDWNGTGGGNTDLGDPVYSMAEGIVTFAEDIRGGWGRILRISHNIGTRSEPDCIEALYAHLDTMLVEQGDTVARGQHIAAIGNAHDIYYAHLHLEIRDTVGLPIGGGYGEETEGYLDPTAFIKAHRPK